MQQSTESFWTAIKNYEERLKKDPSSYCFAPLAEVYLQVGLVDDALSVARAGASRYPGYVAGQMALAKACRQKGLADEGRQALEKVTTAMPDHGDAQRMLARLYADAGRGDDAVRALQVLLDFDPEDVTTKLELQSLQYVVSATHVSEEDDELELIEFTDDDIIEELEEVEDDLLVERVKAPLQPIDDPWAGVGALSFDAPPAPLAEPAAPEHLPDSVSVMEQAALEESIVSSVSGLVATEKPTSEPAVAPNPFEVDEIAEVSGAVAVPEPLMAVEPVIPPVSVATDDAPIAPEPFAVTEVERKPETITGSELVDPVKADEMALGFETTHAPIKAETVETAVPVVAALSTTAESVHIPVEPSVAAVPSQGAADNEAVKVLEGWLENIRRIRECR